MIDFNAAVAQRHRNAYWKHTASTHHAPPVRPVAYRSSGQMPVFSERAMGQPYPDQSYKVSLTGKSSAFHEECKSREAIVPIPGYDFDPARIPPQAIGLDDRRLANDPQLQYQMLIHDISAMFYDSNSCTNTNRYKREFSQSIIFLAFYLIEVDDPLVSSIADLDSSNLIDRLRMGLQDQCRSICPNLNVVMAIRMLLISIGAQRSDAEIFISEGQELNFPKMIYILLGGSKPERLSTEINHPVFLQVLSSTRAFRDYFLDQSYIDRYAQKWGASLWLSLTIVPSNWVSGLSQMELLDLETLWSDSYGMGGCTMRGDNFERIFAIWAYLSSEKCRSQAFERIRNQWPGIFTRANQDLMETSSTTQMVLDLMAMESIVRLFPEAERIAYQKGLTRDLNMIVKRNATGKQSFVVQHFLVSMGNILGESPLVQFIDKILYSRTVLAVPDPIGTHYISQRMTGITHLHAMRASIFAARSRAGRLKRSCG
ncbi:uncharacterized protein FIESC28_10008 [Fusarium coffeatum]|uniref:Uncharacterized protein n=1 Tax=Fusarium coffeatum TaxID=231269 RepID=A0A366QY64_9HYPO|nr:uncharacterized protein FIESC28_10008 [Fusarium coffeatum]RBR09158.1 hypothetical protein FIESC28_10008 [Fusarium coffeatum]